MNNTVLLISVRVAIARQVSSNLRRIIILRGLYDQHFTFFMPNVFPA